MIEGFRNGYLQLSDYGMVNVLDHFAGKANEMTMLMQIEIVSDMIRKGIDFPDKTDFRKSFQIIVNCC